MHGPLGIPGTGLFFNQLMVAYEQPILTVNPFLVRKSLPLLSSVPFDDEPISKS